MTVKKKMLFSIGAIAVGFLAITSGALAFYTDRAETVGRFTTGELDLEVNSVETKNFQWTNIKPGDRLIAMTDLEEPAFILTNKGNLNSIIHLNIDYQTEAGFDNHLFIDALVFGTEDILPNLKAAFDLNNDGLSIAELKNALQGNTVVENIPVNNAGIKLGTLAGRSTVGDVVKYDQKTLKYIIHFKDNGLDQNFLQGKNLQMDFSFTALQENGTIIDRR